VEGWEALNRKLEEKVWLVVMFEKEEELEQEMWEKKNLT